MHVLITGGAGFIGSHLAEFHMQRGDEVHVVDNLSTGCYENVEHMAGSENFHFTEADLLTWDDIGKAVSKADLIYHMAAVVGVKHVLSDPVNVMSTNVSATERLLRAVHGSGHSPHVLIASSSEVYGFNTENEFSERSDLVLRSGGRLRWTYAVTKLADEFLAFSYVRKYGMNIVIARLFNTIGLRQTGRYGMVVPNFIEQALKGEPITVYGEGSQTRSFGDVLDTVRALNMLITCPKAKGEVVNVGSDQEISILNLAELIKSLAESESSIVFVPYLEAYGEEFEDVTHRRPVLDKLKELTGFQHQCGLVETLQGLIEKKK